MATDAQLSMTAMLSRPVYLDNHATTRIDPRAVEAMLPFFSQIYGNAASGHHAFGAAAADAVENSRRQVAGLLCAPEKSLIFTSGGTESNNLALKGVMRAAGPGSHFITAAAEHRSVLDPARKLRRDGYDVTILPVDEYGMVDVECLESEIRPHTVLVSIMLANNEVGTIHPLEEIGAICRKHNVLLHTDAVQAVGKIPVDINRLPVDLLSLTAHKLYGPKGVGALYLRRDNRRINIEPLFDGGGHERGLRSGTLAVPEIVGFGKACEIAAACMADDAKQAQSLRDRLWNGLTCKLDGVLLNGHPDRRLPGNLNASFTGVDGDALLMSLKDLAVSSGSACTSADPTPSHVLTAMGRNDQLTRASLRFGIGRFNTAEEIDFAVEVVATSIKRLRALASGRQ